MQVSVVFEVSHWACSGGVKDRAPGGLVVIKSRKEDKDVRFILRLFFSLLPYL
jgi:hypothetical protein